MRILFDLTVHHTNRPARLLIDGASLMMRKESKTHWLLVNPHELVFMSCLFAHTIIRWGVNCTKIDSSSKCYVIIFVTEST